MDGMNVLSVREGMKHVRDYVSQGNGPMVVEMSTYRYHGHSMSDPGTTYRNRDEIAAMRQTRDPIEFVKNLLLEHTDATEDELKAIEKDVRAVQYELYLVQVYWAHRYKGGWRGVSLSPT